MSRLLDPMLRAGGHQAGPRLKDMDSEGIDVSVLYPASFLGIQHEPDLEFAEVQCRAYNDWLSDHVADSDGRLWGATVLPQQDLELAAKELRRASKLPGIKAAFIRPNPTENWQPFNREVYDPIRAAASDTGLPLGLHPFLAADLPGACVGLRLNEAAATTADALGAGASGGQATSRLGGVEYGQHFLHPGDRKSV